MIYHIFVFNSNHKKKTKIEQKKFSQCEINFVSFSSSYLLSFRFLNLAMLFNHIHIYTRAIHVHAPNGPPSWKFFGLTYEHVHGVHSELNSDQETNLDKMYAKRYVKEHFYIYSIPHFFRHFIFFSFRLFDNHCKWNLIFQFEFLCKN